MSPNLFQISIAALVALSAPVLANEAGAIPPTLELSDEARQALTEIWEMEGKIYAGRARGDVSYYIENTAPEYLAWTSGTPKPFRVDRMIAGKDAMKSRDKEIITSEIMDFSLSGDTAIIYYRNHRKRLPDGTDVDQTYDNIHVWQKIEGDWKVLASMSRHAEQK